MSDVATLLKQMREQREFRVELEAAADDKPAKIVWLLRPLEAAELHLVAAGVSVDALVRFTTRWGGFTEVDLLPGSGGSDKVDYHPDLWRELVGDRRDWAKQCADALVAQIAARAEARQADSGNS
jgi:hypothetical protein